MPTPAAPLTLAQIELQTRQLLADARPANNEFDQTILDKAIDWAHVEICRQKGFTYKETNISVDGAGQVLLPDTLIKVVRVMLGTGGPPPQ